MGVAAPPGAARRPDRQPMGQLASPGGAPEPLPKPLVGQLRHLELCGELLVVRFRCHAIMLCAHCIATGCVLPAKVSVPSVTYMFLWNLICGIGSASGVRGAAPRPFDVVCTGVSHDVGVSTGVVAAL